MRWADFLSYAILAMSALGDAANPTAQTRSRFSARSPQGTSDTLDLCLQTPRQQPLLMLTLFSNPSSVNNNVQISNEAQFIKYTYLPPFFLDKDHFNCHIST